MRLTLKGFVQSDFQGTQIESVKVAIRDVSEPQDIHIWTSIRDSASVFSMGLSPQHFLEEWFEWQKEFEAFYLHQRLQLALQTPHPTRL